MGHSFHFIPYEYLSNGYIFKWNVWSL